MELVQFFREIQIFAHFSDSAITEFAEYLQIQDFDDQYVLIEEGSTGDRFFILIEGEVVVTRGETGADFVLKRLKPGDFFGLMEMFTGGFRTASCTASGAVKVATFLRVDYEKIRNEHSRLALDLQRTFGMQFAQDMRNINRRVETLIASMTSELPPENEYDVVVMGGGPIGLLYAHWVQDFYPEARVAVVERKLVPKHKIGESLLSSTTRAYFEMGLAQPIMRRLFGNKGGLRFFYTNEKTDQLKTQVNLTDLDETYQVERRVLEIAMQNAASRRGINILKGTRVLIKESNLDGPMKEIVCEGPNGEHFELHSPILCDASGSASVLLRHLGLYRKKPDIYDTFNYNSYFAYFRPRKDVPVKLWDIPATRHICFPGGWLWVISLISWEQNDDETLSKMIDYLLDQPEGPDESYLSRDALSEKFGLSYEQVVSFGFTIRSDRDVEKMNLQERFDYYASKFPAISWVLDHFELIETPYEGKRRAHFGFLNMAHDAHQVTGDGWLAIGDAAAFVSPFYSPGLLYGAGMAYKAAQQTARALEKGDTSRQAFADYEAYASDVFYAITKEHDMFYRAFSYEDTYERVMALKIFWSLPTVIYLSGYSEEDTLVHNILLPKWRATVDQAISILKAGEENNLSEAEVTRQFRAMVDSFLSEQTASLKEKGVDMSPYFDFWTPDAVWHEREDKPRGMYKGVQCYNCKLYPDDSLEKCPYCGVELVKEVAT